jgi:hypothetical protein
VQHVQFFRECFSTVCYPYVRHIRITNICVLCASKEEEKEGKRRGRKRSRKGVGEKRSGGKGVGERSGGERRGVEPFPAIPLRW